MFFPPREVVERVRKEYPIGTRVELTRMDDFQAPPIGTKGTVRGVDDTASIMVAWDNGSHLNVVYGEDSCRKLKSVTTICYGEEKTWDSREEAMDFFYRGMMASDGSERNRYTNVFIKLQIGMEVCSDGDE